MTLASPESNPEPTRACDEHHKNLAEALKTVRRLTMTVNTMTSDRTQAYGRVVKTLEDLGPAKLQAAEQERIRDAADNLIFAAGLEDAFATMADVEELAEHLVSTGRWTSERAEQLVSDVLACGPVTPVA
jgi:hypothetical protein